MGSGPSLLKEPLKGLSTLPVMGVGRDLLYWTRAPAFALYAFYSIEEQRPGHEAAQALGIPLMSGWQEGDGKAYGDFRSQGEGGGYRWVYRDHVRPLDQGFIGDVDGELSWVANSISSVLALGVQTAMWLRASPIYLLGCDFSPVGYVTAPKLVRDHPARWEPGGQNLTEVEFGLTTLQQECWARGLELVNLTCETQERVLPKASLEEVA